MEQKEKIKTFKDLRAWQEGHRLVLAIYAATKEFPKEEQFGLTNQLRRAVVSITSNISEGFSRHSMKEKAQFYSMALGSLSEVQNQILIAKDVAYISEKYFQEISEQTVSVSKILNGLIKSSLSRNT